MGGRVEREGGQRRGIAEAGVARLEELHLLLRAMRTVVGLSA